MQKVALWEDDLVISFKKHLVHRYCRDPSKSLNCLKKPPILAFHEPRRILLKISFGVDPALVEDRSHGRVLGNLLN